MTGGNENGGVGAAVGVGNGSTGAAVSGTTNGQAANGPGANGPGADGQAAGGQAANGAHSLVPDRRTYQLRAIYFRRDLFESTADCLTAAHAQQLPLELCR